MQLRDEPWQVPIALMTMSVVPGPVVTIASALAAFLAWVLFHRARQAIKYDLHKVPGPQQAPLLGNLASVIGSSYVHRVRRLTRLLASNSLQRVCSRLRCIHAEEFTVLAALLEVDSDLLSHTCRHAFESRQIAPRVIHAGACSVDHPVWVSFQMEPCGQNYIGYHRP